jgi:hypothetical protein
MRSGLQTSPVGAQAVRGRQLREQEDAWCQSHPDILRSYAGQWIVVEGEGILVHGNDPAELVKEARCLGVRSPYIFRVDDTPPGVIRMGGLYGEGLAGGLRETVGDDLHQI